MPRFRAYAAHQKDGAVAALGVRLGEIGPEHVDIDVHSCGICHNSACWTSTLLLACCSRPSRRRPGHSVFRRRSRHPIDRREAAGGSIAHVTRIRCGGRLARDDGAIMLMLPSLAPTAPPCATRAPRRGTAVDADQSPAPPSTDRFEKRRATLAGRQQPHHLDHFRLVAAKPLDHGVSGAARPPRSGPSRCSARHARRQRRFRGRGRRHSSPFRRRGWREDGHRLRPCRPAEPPLRKLTHDVRCCSRAAMRCSASSTFASRNWTSSRLC